MLIVILLYDQLLFRPLVAWVDRFRFEQEPGARAPRSWALTMHAPLAPHLRADERFYAAVRWRTGRPAFVAATRRALGTHRSASRRPALARASSRCSVLALWHIAAGSLPDLARLKR